MNEDEIRDFNFVRIPLPEHVNAGNVVADFVRYGRAVPLKLAASEAEVTFQQRDGHPALGWVRNLTMTAGGVMASFHSVAKIVRDRVAEGRRLIFTPEIDGARLKGVSVRGMGLPALPLDQWVTLMCESPGMGVHALVRTYCAEHSVPYGEAVRIVLREHPGLGKRYLTK